MSPENLTPAFMVIQAAARVRRAEQKAAAANAVVDKYRGEAFLAKSKVTGLEQTIARQSERLRGIDAVVSRVGIENLGLRTEIRDLKKKLEERSVSSNEAG